MSTIANYLRASSRSARAEARAHARSFAGSGVKAESPKLHFPSARRRHPPSKSVHPSKAPSKGVAGLTSKKTLVRMSNRGIGAGALVRQMNASSLGFVGGSALRHPQGRQVTPRAPRVPQVPRHPGALHRPGHLIANRVHLRPGRHRAVAATEVPAHRPVLQRRAVDHRDGPELGPKGRRERVVHRQRGTAARRAGTR